MLIQVKGKNSNTGQYKTKDLTPSQRIESLADRNYKETGNREADNLAKKNIEAVLKEAKNE